MGGAQEGWGFPPYLYTGAEYRSVYSERKDAWQLVLENMPKEEQEEVKGGKRRG